MRDSFPERRKLCRKGTAIVVKAVVSDSLRVCEKLTCFHSSSGKELLHCDVVLNSIGFSCIVLLFLFIKCVLLEISNVPNVANLGKQSIDASKTEFTDSCRIIKNKING